MKLNPNLIKFFIVVTSLLLPLVTIINDQYDSSLSTNNSNLRDWQNYYADLDAELRDREDNTLAFLSRDINTNITNFNSKLTQDRNDLMQEFESFSSANNIFENELTQLQMEWNFFRDRIRAKDRYLKESIEANLMNTTVADIEMRQLCREMQYYPFNFQYQTMLKAQKLTADFNNLIDNSHIAKFNETEDAELDMYNNFHWYVSFVDGPDYANENISYLYVNTSIIVGEIFSDLGWSPFTFQMNTTHTADVALKYSNFKTNFFSWLTNEEIPKLIASKSETEWVEYTDLLNKTQSARLERNIQYKSQIEANITSFITPLEKSASQFRISVVFLGFSIGLYGMITEAGSNEERKEEKQESLRKTSLLKFTLGSILLIAAVVLIIWGFSTGYAVGLIDPSPIYSI
jgi:hypothetical protein